MLSPEEETSKEYKGWFLSNVMTYRTRLRKIALVLLRIGKRKESLRVLRLGEHPTVRGKQLKQAPDKGTGPSLVGYAAAAGADAIRRYIRGKGYFLPKEGLGVLYKEVIGILNNDIKFTPEDTGSVLPGNFSFASLRPGLADLPSPKKPNDTQQRPQRNVLPPALVGPAAKEGAVSTYKYLKSKGKRLPQGGLRLLYKQIVRSLISLEVKPAEDQPQSQVK